MDGGGGPFSCGPSVECNGAAQYCQLSHGTVVFADAAENTTYACEALPTACLSDHTCSCLESNVSGLSDCSVTDGDLTATAALVP